MGVVKGESSMSRGAATWTSKNQRQCLESSVCLPGERPSLGLPFAYG